VKKFIPTLLRIALSSLHVAVGSPADAAAPLLLEEEPDTHRSVAGIASLYWAARHPTQAWRVFLPDLDSVAGRATSETLTEHHEISAHPSPTILAPDTGGKRVRRTQTGELT